MLKKKLPDGLAEILKPTPWSSGGAVIQNGQSEMVPQLWMIYHQLGLHAF